MSTGLRARARASDPETSHEAAEAATARITDAMLSVLSVFGFIESLGYSVALSDEGFCHYYRNLPTMKQTDQSIRSRRAELARRGLLHLAGTEKNSRGLNVRLWVVSESGKASIRENSARLLALTEKHGGA